MEPFEPLVGTWDVEAEHRLLDDVIRAVWTFEWLEGERFLLVRSRNDKPEIPDGLMVVGPREDGDGLAVEYFDSRGVRRTYETTFADGVWRYRRDHPGFDQRFEARVSGDEWRGLFQLAEQPGEWVDDMTVVFRRR